MQDLESMFLSMGMIENIQQEWKDVEGYLTVPYSDDNIVYINNKEVGDISANIVIVNESYSQYVQFEAPRYEDGVDLITKRIYVHWEQGDGYTGDNVEAVNVKYSAEFIRFGFVVPASALTVDDEIRIMPFATGEHNGNNYVLKTLYGVLCPQMSLNTTAGVNKPNEEWFLTFERKMSSYVEQGTQLLNETKQSEEQTRAIKTFMDDSIFAMVIVNEESGELIQTKDAANMALYEMSVFGKSKQESTTGAQLLPYPYCDTTKTENGITFTDNGDGTITANGTATETAQFLLATNYTVGAESVWLSGCNDGSEATYRIQFFDSSSAFAVNVYDSVGLSMGSERTGYIRIFINKGSILSNVVFYPMINVGDIALPWEPYTGGKPSPNPDYQQEIKSVGGENGSVVVKVVGRNLLKNAAETATVNGITFTVNNDGSVVANGTATANVRFKVCNVDASFKGKFILSGCPVGGSIATYNVDIVESGVRNYGVDSGNGVSIVLNDDATKIVRITLQSGATANNLIFKPMLRHAEVEDDTWEPYQETTMQVAVSGGLPGIPVDSGGNYTDSDGQRYIADEIKLMADGTGKWVHNVGIKYLKDLSWRDSWNNTYPIDDSFIVYAYVEDVKERTANTLLTHFVNNHLILQVKGDYFSFEQGNGKSLGIRMLDTTASNLTEWKEWIEANDAYVIYELAEPYETDLSAEEVEAFLLLRMNKFYNTVFNDANAYQRIKYIADPKTYIDNKIAEAIQTIAEPV